MSAGGPDEPDVLRTPLAGALVIRGGALRGGGYAAGVLLGAATAVVLTRALGVEDFGRYGAVAAVIGIVSVITDAGLTAVGSRELALRPRSERGELLRTLVALRLVISLAAVAAGTAFSALVGYDRIMVAGTALAGLGVLLVNTQATAMMPLSVELRVGTVTAFETLKQALTLAGVGALAAAGAPLLAYFLVQAGVGAAALALTPLALGGAASLAPRLDRRAAGRLLREALPVALAIVMNVVYLRLLVILVSLGGDNRETGLYATAFRVIEMLVGLPTLVLSVALPLLSVAGSDPARLRYAVQRLFDVAILGGAAVALATAAFAGPVVPLLFGEEFAGAVTILHVQAWALVPLFAGQAATLALVAMREQRSVAFANVGAVITVLAGGALAVPAWGAEGAAGVAVAAELVLAGLLFAALARRARGVAPSFRDAWRAAVALAAGVAPLALLGGWAGAAAAAVAFGAAAAAVGAVPPEVAAALLRRRGDAA